MQLEHARGEPEPSDGFYERALLVAALLPCFLLAFDPLGLTSRQDPLPELAATALAAAASLPAALLLLARGSLPRLRGAAPLGLSALVLFYTAFFSRGTDTLEAWRDGAHAGACAVALFAGAALRARGRRLLLRGVLLVGLVQLAFALGRWAFSLDDAPGGMPDNTGLVSQAALPGAVIGAWLALSRRGRWRVLGLSTALGFVLHASLAPVLAGGLALALSLSAAALLSPWARERRDVRALFGGLAAIALFGVLLASSPVDEPAPSADTSASAPGEAGDLGGVSVRLSIWRSLPALVRDEPLRGVGAGQFAAAYPPYRDPAEIERSSLNRSLPAEVEVQHAHHDALQAFAQLGLIGGGAFLLFLLVAARAVLAGLTHRAPRRAALACATGSVLLAGLAHAPLLENPAAALVGWLLLGSLLALPGGVLVRRAQAARALAALPLVLLVPGMARIPGVLQHGEALAELSREDSSALARALEGAPDSSFALALEARTRSELHSWDPVLELRPHSIEALNNSAVRHARAGELGIAIERWTRVLELDPGHDGALSYVAQHELERGNDSVGLDALARLRASGRLREGAAELLAASTTLAGNLSGAVAVLASEDPAGAAPSAYALDARADELQSEADAAMPAAGIGALAHWLWGREHAEAGNFDDARRSYYRAWRIAQGAGATPRALGLELSAAYLRDEKPEEARALLDVLGPLEDVPPGSLPSWASEALTP